MLLTLPLFPLHTVLFPSGFLPLRIFEPRYISMVSYCLRHDSPFGVCLIREGQELGEVAITFEVGTLARITDFHQREDGLLGIEAVGQQRFRVKNRQVQSNKLLEGTVELIADEVDCEIPMDYLPLADLLEQFLVQLGEVYQLPQPHYESASWVSNRLAELLPMSLTQRQYLLEINDPLQRFEVVQQVVKNLEVHL